MQTLSKNDPKSIGPFTLVARLGAGGMGVVYLATRGTQSVALKVLNSATLEDPSARTRFKKEIQTLSQVNSPFVARVIDSHADAETAWLAVEFINGPNLKALVEDRGPLPLDQWITLAQGLLSGLQAIHAEGVIHRDIKPGNILISETGPKIIDFGISQDLDATSLTTTGLMAGSPAWLSPEQIDGTKLTPATDVFSAGSVLHYAATGVSPWGNQNSTTTSVIFNNILTKAPNTSKIPEPQKSLIDALLEKEVQSRPNAPEALELLDAFGEVSSKAQIVNSVQARNSKKVTDKTLSTGKKVRETEITTGKASAAFAAGFLLIALVFVTPALLNQPPAFVCAETSYASGDLTEATFSTLEDTVFSNVLSRECKTNSVPVPIFDYEHCQARNLQEPTAVGTYYDVYDFSKDQDAVKRRIGFDQSASGKFGCRTFVQLGLMTEAESRFGFLGFSLLSAVPMLEENGTLASQESRYTLMFDGNSGTFVTRFYATDRTEVPLSIATPNFGKIQIGQVEFKSGRFSDVSDFWIIDSSAPRAEIVFCYVDIWREDLLSKGLTPELTVRNAGNWISAGEVEWEYANCEGAKNLGTIGEVNLSTLLTMDSTPSTCNEIRFVIPGTAQSPRDTFVYCFYIEES